ncbi:MAG TPA: rod shape-determining protein RodA [Candidatus Vogelbacteria bacterium]|nr:rod shape-determining protein RodA [Candidatus Vogelbacteria bacterium]
MAIFYFLKNKFSHLDWILFLSIPPLLLAGLLTMNSFTAESYYFNRQIVWIFISLIVFFSASLIDWRFLRRPLPVVFLYLSMIFPLIFLLIFSSGARAISIAGVSFQPAEFIKIFLIIILAKYLSKRHIEIANIRHIIVSGIYAFIPFVLVLLQPDFGSAMIIFFIWLGMIMVSGISKKHLFLLILIGIISFGVGWNFVLHDYQKQRITSFLHPLADIQGAGYNAFQSKVAVGSGQIFGKGVGFGSQSRLSFLPEYQTDFIYAAFAEEWGFIGSLLIFLLFFIIIWRILANSLIGATNFETLFAVGLSVVLMSHFIIHIGMNIGLLPITGLPLPFLSYGGSHLLAEFLGLGILMGMRKYSLVCHRDDMLNEFIGPV